MPPAGASTATTSNGVRAATARSSSGCSTSPGSCRRLRRRVARDLGGEGVEPRARPRVRGPHARRRLLPGGRGDLRRGERFLRPRDAAEVPRDDPRRQGRSSATAPSPARSSSTSSPIRPSARCSTSLKRRRGGGEELLAYREGRRWKDIQSSDINDYIKEVAGERVQREGLPDLERHGARSALPRRGSVPQRQAGRARPRASGR